MALADESSFGDRLASTVCEQARLDGQQRFHDEGVRSRDPRLAGYLGPPLHTHPSYLYCASATPSDPTMHPHPERLIEADVRLFRLNFLMMLNLQKTEFDDETYAASRL